MFFVSCRFVIPGYSWCLTNMRSLSHCPQCTRKARGQRSAACTELRVNRGQRHCPLGSVCHQKLLLGQTQTFSSPAITTCGAWKQKETTSRLCSACGDMQKGQDDGTWEGWGGGSGGRALHRAGGRSSSRKQASSSGQEMNWKRSERVNRVLGTDSAYNRHSVNNVSYLENLVKEVKHRLFWCYILIK